MEGRGEVSSGRVFAGRAAGRDAEPFSTAVRARIEYARRGGKSSGRPIFVDDGVRRVCAGQLLPDGVFEKKVKTSHILQKPRAIAVQKEALDHVKASGGHTVRALLVEAGVTLEAPLSDFFQHGFAVRRGYGEQIGLPLGWWRDANASSAQGVLF